MLKNNTYLAAVSGGPDSMALLDIYKKQISIVCHVNYHWRIDSDNDEKIVRQYCKKNKIKCCVLNINPNVYKLEKIKNFENWARQKRYDFFLDISKKNKINKILIGHNLDDFVESVLMQKDRKIFTYFYGIKKINNYSSLKIYRPLINKRKKELEEYCNINNINYSIDSTNSDVLYLRNKWRKKISLLTKKEFMQIYKNAITYNKKSNRIYSICVKKYNQWKNAGYNVKFFNSINDKKIIFEIIYLLLIEISPLRISSNKINGIIKFIQSNKWHCKYRINRNLTLLKMDQKITINKIDHLK